MVSAISQKSTHKYVLTLFYQVPSPQSQVDCRRSSHSRTSGRWTSKDEVNQIRRFSFSPEGNHQRHSSQYPAREDGWMSSPKRESSKADVCSQSYSMGHRHGKTSKSREYIPTRRDTRSHRQPDSSRFEKRQPSAINVTTW